MDALRLLVLEQDAQARTLLARFEPGAFFACPAGARADAALCAQSEGLAELLAHADGAPVVAVVSDAYAARRAIAAGAADAVIDDASVLPMAQAALRSAAALARAKSALAASLDELEQQRSALLQSNALKSDLIATLAHDIKGPLTSIIGFAELLEEGYLEGTDATDAARTIRSNAQRLSTLASDILALSRVEHGELEIADDRVNLCEILQHVVDEARGEREIAFDAADVPAHVRGDGERLRQAFDNLVRNAIKYSPGGEAVRVDVEERDGAFHVCVIDRGIGIPPDEMGKLFARFGRASNARKSKIAGTGVGLFIVKTIVERHGGSVAVESTLGNGSTFTVSLPSMDEAEKAPGRTVIVTPDAQLRRFVAYELRSRGLRVRDGVNLEEAQGHAREGDVLLVDTQLCDAASARRQFPSARLIGMGVMPGEGWDASLATPFLVGELIELLHAR